MAKLLAEQYKLYSRNKNPDVELDQYLVGLSDRINGAKRK